MLIEDYLAFYSSQRRKMNSMAVLVFRRQSLFLSVLHVYKKRNSEMEALVV